MVDFGGGNYLLYCVGVVYEVLFERFVWLKVEFFG